MSESKAAATSRSHSPYSSSEEELKFLRQRVGEVETQNQQLYQQVFLLQQHLATSDLNERERAEFISHVGHELRTPLTSIKGYIDLVLEGETGPISDLQRDFLSVVGLNAEKLARIISDLLDVSRLEANMLNLKPGLVDLKTLAVDTSTQVRPQLEARGVRLEVEASEDTNLIASLDTERFNQALRALIAHAGEVTPSGKTVRFRVGLTADRTRAELRIEDEGPGIEPHDLNRVFNKFWRPQNQSWREGSGPGLGLAIAKTIIDLHEGRIWAENQPDVSGGVIIITLPLMQQPELTSFLPPQELPQAPHYAALVVSQDADFGRVIEQTLGTVGFQVIVAQSYNELVSDTPSWQPDLIIHNSLEFGLPTGENGKQLSPALLGAAILTLNLTPVEQRVIAAGARAVLPWPASENVILEALETTIVPEDVVAAEFKQQQTVLLVSPSSDSLRSLDKLVREAGFTKVYRAMREADALTLARRYRPNWLLLDIPGELDGSEDEPTLFEVLREDQLLSKTPSIIFLRPEQIAPDPSPDYKPTPSGGERSRANGTSELRSRRSGQTEGLKRTNTTGELKGEFYNVVPKPFLQRRLLTVALRLAAKH